jgi:hypothetical protein
MNLGAGEQKIGHPHGPRNAVESFGRYLVDSRLPCSRRAISELIRRLGRAASWLAGMGHVNA